MKKSPLTPAQRKRVQRARDKAILKQCGFNSLEDLMRMFRKLDAEGRKKLMAVIGNKETLNQSTLSNRVG